MLNTNFLLFVVVCCSWSTKIMFIEMQCIKTFLIASLANIKVYLRRIFTKTMKIDALKYNWNHSIINITAVYTKKQLTIALLGNKQNESKCRHYCTINNPEGYYRLRSFIPIIFYITVNSQRITISNNQDRPFSNMDSTENIENH